MAASLRTINLDGTPWFYGPDVCRCLGLSPNNSSGAFTKHFRKLADDEKRVESVPVEQPVPSRGRQMMNQTVISESGLYSLIMRAQRTRPEVAKFQDWVAREGPAGHPQDGGLDMP